MRKRWLSLGLCMAMILSQAVPAMGEETAEAEVCLMDEETAETEGGIPSVSDGEPDSYSDDYAEAGEEGLCIKDEGFWEEYVDGFNQQFYLLGNLRHSVALHAQPENLPHHLGGFLVHDPMQLVLRVFDIPVWRIRAERLSRLSLCLENGAYLPARILGVELVENVDERCHVVHSFSGTSRITFPVKTAKRFVIPPQYNSVSLCGFFM